MSIWQPKLLQGSTQGFSVVGILVALAISSVLLNGLVNIFASNQSTSRMMFSFGTQQESARAATDTLVFALRQAGHFGGVDLTDISNHADLDLTGIGGCNQAWITDVTAPIRSFDGASSLSGVSNLPSSCIDSSEYVANTDILTLKYASSIDAAETGSLDDDTIYVRTIVGGMGASQAEIFLGDDGSSIGGSSDPVGTFNYKYSSEMYYIRSCSAKIDGECTDSTPSLVKVELDESTFTERLLVEGVEQFQVEFGIDTDGDLTSDRYLSASSVTNWDLIQSIKFSLVIRGNAKDPSITDTSSYALLGGVTFTPSGEAQSYKRRVYTKVVQLRNMNRG